MMQPAHPWPCRHPPSWHCRIHQRTQAGRRKASTAALLWRAWEVAGKAGLPASARRPPRRSPPHASRTSPPAAPPTGCAAPSPRSARRPRPRCARWTRPHRWPPRLSCGPAARWRSGGGGAPRRRHRRRRRRRRRAKTAPAPRSRCCAPTRAATRPLGRPWPRLPRARAAPHASPTLQAAGGGRRWAAAGEADCRSRASSGTDQSVRATSMCRHVPSRPLGLRVSAGCLERLTAGQMAVVRSARCTLTPPETPECGGAPVEAAGREKEIERSMSKQNSRRLAQSCSRSLDQCRTSRAGAPR